MLAETSTVIPTKPVRIVIADDHPCLADGFCSAIRKHPQALIAGQASNGEELIKLVEEMQPDIVITDIQMPVKDGIAATKEIKERFPYIHVIAFSAFPDDCYVTDMIEAGASGYLLKNEHIKEIIKAIEKVMSGEVYYSHEISNKMVGLMQSTSYNPLKPFSKPHFTEKELNVFKETGNGLSPKEIAQKLAIETRSVESARRRLLKKTGSRNIIELVLYGVRNFIIRL